MEIHLTEDGLEAVLVPDFEEAVRSAKQRIAELETENAALREAIEKCGMGVWVYTIDQPKEEA